MGKFLRVLVVLNVLLAAGVITMGILLFNKREILIGRNTILENYAIKLGRTIEASDTEAPAVTPDREEQDLAGTVNPNATPEPDTFWNSYRTELENMVNQTVALDNDLVALRNYFKRGVDNKIETDVNGAKISTGEGTTDGSMKVLLDRANKQYEILNATRSQLEATRKYLEEVIANHNEVKITARQRQGIINDLNAQIAQLNATINGLRNEIAMLKDQITSLEGQITELESSKRVVEEARDTLQAEKDRLLEQNKMLRERLRAIKDPNRVKDTIGTTDGTLVDAVPLIDDPGVKGKVVAVNETLGFVVMELDAPFIDKLNAFLEPYRDGMLPQIEIMLVRDSEFVAKVRLRDLDERPGELLVVGDILPQWQQRPIQVGDAALYKMSATKTQRMF